MSYSDVAPVTLQPGDPDPIPEETRPLATLAAGVVAAGA